MNTFDFSECLSCLNCDMTVGINIDGKERHYHMEDGIVYCTIGNSIKYAVKAFYADAVMSNQWFLVE